MGKSKTEEEKEKHAMRERLRRRKFCNLYWSLREYGSFNLPASATDYEYLVAALGEAGWVVQNDGMARRVEAASQQRAQAPSLNPMMDHPPMHLGDTKKRRAADGGKLMREEMLKKGDVSLIDPDGTLSRLMHYAELPQFIPNLLQGWVSPKELPSLTEGELEDLGLPQGACKKLKRALARAVNDPSLVILPPPPTHQLMLTSSFHHPYVSAQLQAQAQHQHQHQQMQMPMMPMNESMGPPPSSTPMATMLTAPTSPLPAPVALHSPIPSLALPPNPHQEAVQQVPALPSPQQHPEAIQSSPPPPHQHHENEVQPPSASTPPGQLNDSAQMEQTMAILPQAPQAEETV